MVLSFVVMVVATASFSGIVTCGPFESNIGLPRTRPGFMSNIVLGLMATILAPIGPE